MRLSDWAFLFLLLSIPLLHFWWKERNKPARIIFPLTIPKGVSSANPLRTILWMKYAGLIFLILGLARPQSHFKQIDRTVSGIEIMMILDVSNSMSIEDMEENRSRLDVAKSTMESFIRGRGNDRIGFVMFSGEPLTLVPPTLDYGLLIGALNQANVGVLRDGTAIGDGLVLAVSHLKSSQAKSRIVVLLTDGDNNLGQVDPKTAGELAAGYGIRTYTIAIGREGPVRMPIRQKDVFGRTVTTYQMRENTLNPDLLKWISERTRGKFYRATDKEALESVFDEIDRLEKTEIQVNEKMRYEEMYQGFLKVGALLLICQQFLEHAWWRVYP